MDCPSAIQLVFEKFHEMHENGLKTFIIVDFITANDGSKYDHYYGQFMVSMMS
jgi:hypothetical protein